MKAFILICLFPLALNAGTITCHEAPGAPIPVEVVLEFTDSRPVQASAIVHLSCDSFEVQPLTFSAKNNFGILFRKFSKTDEFILSGVSDESNIERWTLSFQVAGAVVREPVNCEVR